MFGEKLKQLRDAKGLSIPQVAGLSGVSRQAIWEIENGKSEPKFSTIQSIAKGLKVKADIFFDKKVRHTQHANLKNKPYKEGA